MPTNQFPKKYRFAPLWIAAFTLTALATSTLFAHEKVQHPQDKHQIVAQSKYQSNHSLSSNPLGNKHSMIHLRPETFQFESRVEFAASVRTSPAHYAESINHTNKGAIDVTLLNQGNSVRYLFQISSIPKQQCESDRTGACEQEAISPARGDIAEIQFVLQGNQLVPGIYRFGNAKPSPIEDVTLYSRKLYSDPSHGKVGCQTWGRGELNVKRADYDENGNLQSLEASLFRVCDQTAPFPPTSPQDNLPQNKMENIEKYTYHASWSYHAKQRSSTLNEK